MEGKQYVYSETAARLVDNNDLVVLNICKSYLLYLMNPNVCRDCQTIFLKHFTIKTICF